MGEAGSTPPGPLVPTLSVASALSQDEDILCLQVSFPSCPINQHFVGIFVSSFIHPPPLLCSPPPLQRWYKTGSKCS